MIITWTIMPKNWTAKLNLSGEKVNCKSTMTSINKAFVGLTLSTRALFVMINKFTIPLPMENGKMEMEKSKPLACHRCHTVI